jgi:hypothetical protein
VPLCISINIATEAMEGIYERLCWMYITVITVNTLVYDQVGNIYHLSNSQSYRREGFHILSSLLTSLSISRNYCFRTTK